MKVRFYIEKRKDKMGNPQLRDRPVFMSVSFNGIRLMIGTDVKIDQSAWDAESQRVKNIFPGSIALNNRLETMRDTAELTMKALQNSGEAVGPDQFKNLIQELKPKISNGLFDVFYLFLEEGSSRWSKTTYQKVRTIYNHLREFEDVTGSMIAFRNINAGFLEQFAAFYKNKGNRESTTAKAVSILVWFLNWATDQEYNIYREYRSFYKILKANPTESGSHLYLQWNELTTINDFSSDNRRTERVRDLFCFMCFSGLRFSDLQRLKKGDIEKDEIVVKKPGAKIRRVPLNKYSREIYQNYINKFYLDNTAFPSISIVTMNKYIRIIGQEAGLTRQVFPPASVSGGGSRVPLYECLTAGIAINTFIANALELNIPADILSGFTGVRDDHRVERIRLDLAKNEMKKFEGKGDLS